MGFLQGFHPIEVGKSPRNAKKPKVSPSAQRKSFAQAGEFFPGSRSGSQVQDGFEGAGGGGAEATPLLARILQVPCFGEARANFLICWRSWRALKDGSGDGTHFHAEVEAVQKGPAGLELVGLESALGASAWMNRVTGEPARAGIHGCNEQTVRGETSLLPGAMKPDFVLLQGLAQPFQEGAGEFREFVQEEDSPVGSRDFSRTDGATSSEKSLGRGARVGSPERGSCGK